MISYEPKISLFAHPTGGGNPIKWLSRMTRIPVPSFFLVFEPRVSHQAFVARQHTMRPMPLQSLIYIFLFEPIQIYRNLYLKLSKHVCTFLNISEPIPNFQFLFFLLFKPRVSHQAFVACQHTMRPMLLQSLIYIFLFKPIKTYLKLSKHVWTFLNISEPIPNFQFLLFF